MIERQEKTPKGELCIEFLLITVDSLYLDFARGPRKEIDILKVGDRERKIA